MHTELGPGLLEKTYESCLRFELEKRGMTVLQQVELPVLYRGVKIVEVGYRIDLLVNGELIVEVKAVEGVLPVHRAQLLSYLRLSKKRLGLLLNFNVERLTDGITRLINGYEPGVGKGFSTEGTKVRTEVTEKDKNKESKNKEGEG